MDDPLLVRGLQRLGDLSGDQQCVWNGNGSARDEISERDAVHQLHHDRTSGTGVFQPIDVRDVRMVQRREASSLALEASEAVGVIRGRLRQHFDRHVALEFAVVGAIDFTHPAHADLSGELVRSETGAGNESQASFLDHVISRRRCL